MSVKYRYTPCCIFMLSHLITRKATINLSLRAKKTSGQNGEKKWPEKHVSSNKV